MSPDQLLNDLKEKFNIIEMIDLADCAEDPTLAYRLFDKKYKEYYEPNERFVFYTNSFVGKKSIDYLKHAADLINVSRCFILICCTGIDQQLSQFDIEISETFVESKKFDELLLPDVNSICVLPWMHLEVMNRGNIKACCFIEESISQTKDVSDLNQLFHGSEMNQLRSNLFRGNKIDACNACWHRESQGIESLRQWRIKSHAREFFMEKITSPRLVSLVLRPSTVCNFKCRICNSTQSSQWAKEDLAHETDPIKIQKLHRIIDEGKWFDHDNSFPQLVLNAIPKLEFLDIYGGEPLMIKQFKTLLTKSIDSGSASQQKLHFNTNGSIFPENLIPLMEKFKEVTVSLSIDDVGPRFEIARGGLWEEIENNVNRFLLLPKDRFKISLLVTVSNLNVLYLDEIINWAKDKNIPITLQSLLTPKYLRFDHITQSLRDRIIDKLSDYPDTFTKKIVAELTRSMPVDVKEWRQQMKKLDIRRGQNLDNTHKELCWLMDYDLS